MARTTEHRTRHRHWSLILPLAGAVLTATIRTVVAVRRLTTGDSGAAVTKPWKILAAALILGGLAQGLVGTASVQALREQYHPSISFDSALTTAVFAMPWSILAFGLLAAASAAAVTCHSAPHEMASPR